MCVCVCLCARARVCVCVCVGVCERERERERENCKINDVTNHSFQWDTYAVCPSVSDYVMGDVKHRDVDGGWAWVALVASVMNLALFSCFIVSVGFFQVRNWLNG